MADLDLRDAVRAAGADPDDIAVERMRMRAVAAFHDEPDDAMVALRPVQLLRRPARAWFGVAAAAALLVGGVAVWMRVARSESEPGIPPVTTELAPTSTSQPPPSTTVDPAAAPVTLADLAGDTWLMTSGPRGRLDTPIIPSLTVAADGTLSGFDGCNLVSGSIGEATDGLTLAFDPEPVACNAPYDVVAAPRSGDRVERVDADTVRISGADGRNGMLLQRMSAYGRAAARDDIVGVWRHVADLTFAESGALTVSGATGTWEYDGSLHLQLDLSPLGEALAVAGPERLDLLRGDWADNPAIDARIDVGGNLVLGRPGGLVRVFRRPPTAAAPSDADVVVGGTDGAPLLPQTLARLPIGPDGAVTEMLGEFAYRNVALLPDGVLVIDEEPTGPTGRGVMLDRRTGSITARVTVDIRQGEAVQAVLGSPEGVVYVATGGASLEFQALIRAGDSWVPAGSSAGMSSVGDSAINLTCAGLTVGGTVVLPRLGADGEPSTIACTEATATAPAPDAFDVIRTGPGGEEGRWRVGTVPNTETPGTGAPRVYAVGNGALAEPGNALAAHGWAMVGVDGAADGWVRSNGWTLLDADVGGVLVGRVDGIAGVYELGWAWLPPYDDGIDLVRGTLFGYAIQTSPDGATAEQLLADMSSRRGAPTDDSGWVTVPEVTFDDGTADCLTGKAYRVLRWGDARFSFWRGEPGDETLWSWTVGDVRASGYLPPEPAPSNVEASGVTTVGGLGVGTPRELFTAMQSRPYGPVDGWPETWVLGAVTGGAHAQFTVADGAVTGIGVTLAFC